MLPKDGGGRRGGGGQWTPVVARLGRGKVEGAGGKWCLSQNRNGAVRAESWARRAGAQAGPAEPPRARREAVDHVKVSGGPRGVMWGREGPE